MLFDSRKLSKRKDFNGSLVMPLISLRNDCFGIIDVVSSCYVASHYVQMFCFVFVVVIFSFMFASAPFFCYSYFHTHFFLYFFHMTCIQVEVFSKETNRQRERK